MRRQSAVLTVMVVLSGCKGPDDEGGPVELPEEVGDKVVDGLVYQGRGNGQRIAWSPDGTELYYIAAGDWVELQDPYSGTVESDLAAVDVDSASSRVVATAGPIAGDLQVSPDGAWLYHYSQAWDPEDAEPYGLEPSYLYARASVAEGTVETLIEGAPDYMGDGTDGDRTDYALSPDGSTLAFHRGANTPISLYEIAHTTETELEVEGAPLLFSPDGSALLSVDGDAHRITSLDDGTTSLFPWEDPELEGGNYWNTPAWHWGDDVLEVVTVRAEAVEDEWYTEFTLWVTDQDGNECAITDASELRHESGAGGALSPDGTRAAVWFSDCLEWTQLGDCTRDQASLYLVDMSSGEVTRVGATQEVVVTMMAFSPDGSRLAYGSWIGSGDLYVHELP